MDLTRGIWTIAASLVSRLGPAAPDAVDAKIVSLRRDDANAQTIASWVLVDRAVHELVRVTRHPAETIH